MKIDVFDLLLENKICYARVNDKFRDVIKSRINSEFKSIKEFCKEIKSTNYRALLVNLRKGKYHRLYTLIEIANKLNISKKEVYSSIVSFFASGSNTKKEVFLPRFIGINGKFVEGYALYLAEGDNGANGIEKPRKVRFTNSDLGVINYFHDWLKMFFPNNKTYVRIMPPGTAYNKITKYRLCLDSAILIDFLLDIKRIVKDCVKEDSRLRRAYIRGMMIGEGTAYFNRSRYVRIEMRNEDEIKYLHELLQKEGYDCKPSLRKERENMWSLFIGAKQLRRFYDEIGFGINLKRQEVLKKAINKKLRKNQYI